MIDLIVRTASYCCKMIDNVELLFGVICMVGWLLGMLVFFVCEVHG